MDFRQWKKIKEDGKSCTLVHPKGHEMTIAVKALPKILQEQIRRLDFAHGGKVESNDHLATGKNGTSEQGSDVRFSNAVKRGGGEGKISMNYAKDEARGRAKMERTVKPKMKGLAHGGEVKYDRPELAKQGEERLRAKHKETPEGKARNEKFWSEAERTFRPVSKTKAYAEGGVTEQDPAAEPQQSMDAPAQNGPPITINVGAPSAPAAPVVTQPPPVAQAPIATRAPKPPIPVAPNPNLMLQDETVDAPAAAKLEQKAIQQQVPIDIQKARELNQNEQEYLDRTNAAAQNAANNVNELKNHADETAAAIQGGLIDPKRFQNNMTDSEKVKTTIGLMLGGLGVPFGGHNYAYEFLNKQIDRDIDAQKSRHEQQKTIWGAYHALYGDQVVANNMTKVAALDNLTHQTNQVAAQLGTAQAKQNANSFAAKAALERNQLLINSAGRLGTLQAGGGAPGQTAAPGTPGAMSAPKEKRQLEEGILHPGSERMFQGLQYTPKAKDLLPEITRQFTQAQQADKALGSVNETFLSLWKAANEGDVGGRVHRTLNPHSIAAIGAGLGSFAGPPGAAIGAGIGEGIGQGAQQMTNTDMNRRYDSEQSKLKGYISAALKGTNIGSHDIDDIVDKNSPEYGDTPKTMAKKLKTIREFIKNHTETSLLKTWHLTKD